VLGSAELAVQLGELAGVLGDAALGRGGELGAQPIDNLGVLGRGPLLGGAGVAADPVEFGLVLGAPRGQRGVAAAQPRSISRSAAARALTRMRIWCRGARAGRCRDPARAGKTGPARAAYWAIRGWSSRGAHGAAALRGRAVGL
jgi:hypothetical protein